MLSSQPVVTQRRQGPSGLADALVLLVVMFVAGWFVVAWAIIRRPILGVPAVVFAGLCAWIGMHDAQALVIYAAVALVVWRVAHRSSYERLVGGRLRRAWRRLWVYERHWRRTMVMSGLGKRYRLRESVPRIRGVEGTRWCDRVQIKLVRGQCTEDVEQVAPELAHSFGARACRVRELGPGRLSLDFTTSDPLIEPISALPIPDVVDLRAVPVGLQEDGEPWRLRLLGTHLLIAGVTESGKSSVLWSLLRGLAPAIRDGQVVVWGIDPKGGMELGMGRELFGHLCGITEMADMLDEAVSVMDDRAERLAGVTRLHTPTVAEPLHLVCFDEVATGSAYLPDSKVRGRINNSLALLASKGRAVGVSAVVLLQDARAEILASRKLFPTRVAMQLAEKAEVDMVLGEGARDKGALCDKIPDSLRGVGFVCLDGKREPMRVRAAHVTDPDIRAMARDYAPGSSPAARLQAVLEGRGDGTLAMTRGQAAELDERRRAWGLPNRKQLSS
jgi:DNA segregation ATPase FtsK/SpoIIIE, S-DNA-T family